MIIVQTPLRVSLFGGGTDFPEFYKNEGGCVLTTAINKYIYVIVKSRFDSNVRLTYTKAEFVNKSSELKHDIVRECLKHVGINHGVEIITIGDVPGGSGLGSSSAVTVGVLKALYAYIGQETAAEELAQTACFIEREALHKPIGIQDQYISAYGGSRFIEFGSGVVSRKLSFGKISEHLLLFFTGITRSSEKILRVQSNNLSKNLDALRKIKRLTYQAVKEVKKNNGNAFGKLLDESWQQKKLLAKSISSTKINFWYKKAKDAGALGGKILGAGGGGFLLFYCPNGSKEKVRLALSKLTEIPIQPEPDGTKVILNYRT